MGTFLRFFSALTLFPMVTLIRLPLHRKRMHVFRILRKLISANRTEHPLAVLPFPAGKVLLAAAFLSTHSTDTPMLRVTLLIAVRIFMGCLSYKTADAAV